MALKQYLLEAADGQSATTTNTQAQQIVRDGGTTVFSSAKAFAGATGMKLTSLANNLCVARFLANAPSTTMAATFGLTMPETDVPTRVWVASLINDTNPACVFMYTPDRKLGIFDYNRQDAQAQWLMTSVAPGTKLRIAIRAQVATSTTGSYTINIYNGQSGTPVAGSPFQSSSFNLGTAPIRGGDFGVLSIGSTEAVAVGIDDIQFNDGSTVEIGAVGAGGSTGGGQVAVQDLVWVGTEWR